MNPIDFPGSNQTLGAPKGMPECDQLRIHTNGAVCTSVWELSGDEVADIVNSRRIAIGVYSGGVSQPPISLEVLKTQNASPYLPPCLAYDFDEPAPMPSDDVLAKLPADHRAKCRSCGHPKALHLNITMQCPRVGRVGRDILSQILGFEATTFEPVPDDKLDEQRQVVGEVINVVFERKPDAPTDKP